MSRTLEKPTQKPNPNTCQVVQNPDGVYCIRCNIKGDSPDAQGWSCCPNCGGELVRGNGDLEK
ncbi:MAG: hypothetical protein PVH87_26490 [Desulfobacteraceae bacterium]